MYMLTETRRHLLSSRYCALTFFGFLCLNLVGLQLRLHLPSLPLGRLPSLALLLVVLPVHM